MTSILLVVGIGTSLLFVGLLGGYMISGQTMQMNLSSYDVQNNFKSIHMGMNMFMPNQLQIEPNTTISWQTHDMETHNVSGIFKTGSGKEIAILSGDIRHMEKWNYTFEESGIFEYTCGYHEHEGMKGEIIVVS
jgi:plastocyanin